MDKEKGITAFPVGLTVAAVGGATLCLLGGISILAIGLKAAAGGLVWYGCHVAAEDVGRLQAAQAAAEGSQSETVRRQWYAVALEIMASMVGAAVFLVINPAVALWAFPFLALPMVVYQLVRQHQAEKLMASIAAPDVLPPPAIPAQA